MSAEHLSAVMDRMAAPAIPAAPADVTYVIITERWILSWNKAAASAKVQLGAGESAWVTLDTGRN